MNQSLKPLTSRYFCLAVILTFLVVQSCASTARTSDRPRLSLEYLHARITEILSQPELAQTYVGIKVVSLRSGETLYDHQSDRLSRPASIVKLFTAASALKTLGPDYRHTTTLSIEPGFSVINDTLYTPIYIKGTGDPLLNTENLRTLTEYLVELDIDAVVGDVIADDTYFDDVRLGSGWMWDDVEYGYSAQISALTVNGNCITVVVTPGDSIGAPVRVQLEPPTSFVEIQIEAETVVESDESDDVLPLKIKREWQNKKNVIHVSGQMAMDRSERRVVRTIEDPALYTATLFKDLLTDYGVHINGSVRRGALPPQTRTIAVYESKPLVESVHFMLKDSDNLTAELLTKTLGVYESGTPGITDNGLRITRRILAEEAHIDTLQYHLVDGSGLSMYNLVTPAQTIDLLKYLYRDPTLKAFIMDGLPVAGIDGTLEYRMKSSLAYRNLKAKTGSMSAINCISGYVGLDEEEPLAFSIMMNHYIGSSAAAIRAQDAIGAVLANYSRRPQFARR